MIVIVSKLVMLQTTNPIIDKTIYKQATPNALLAWHRVRLANWLADNGKDWSSYITQYNSGLSSIMSHGLINDDNV